MLPAHKHTLETLITDAVQQVAQATQGASEAAFVTPSIVLERPKVAAHGDNTSGVQSIPVYDADGTTQIGSFRVGG